MPYEKGARWILARPNQIFAFRPFIFFLKDNKFCSAWRLAPMTAHLIAVFYHWHWANAWLSHFKILRRNIVI